MLSVRSPSLPPADPPTTVIWADELVHKKLRKRVYMRAISEQVRSYALGSQNISHSR